MEKFIIQGGVPLSGEIVPAGNKNAALPILAACLLTEEELVVRNVPRHPRRASPCSDCWSDSVSRSPGRARTRSACGPTSISGTEVDEELANRIRASFLVAGPLLARFGEVRMPPPAATRSAGAAWTHTSTPSATSARRSPATSGSSSRRRPDGLKPTRIFMDEPSVMGTENALLAAALTEGPTTIANAACEPHVQDLARLLCKMGAQVDGIGSNVMTVHGQKKLGGAEHDDLPRPHRDRELHGPGRGDQR